MRHYLSIALDNVDSNVYGSPCSLPDCVIDGVNFLKSMRAGADNSRWLRNEAATIEGVKRIFRHFAYKLVSGDELIVHYSGHGGYLADVSGDEADGQDETWCLYDGQLIDDEIHKLLGIFRAGVSVVVISDSCHSGTITRVAPIPVKPKSRGLFGVILSFFVSKKEAARKDNITANVLLLSGCQDRETSKSTGSGGAFTLALLKAWPKAQSWGGLYNDVLYYMKKADQKPNFYVLGKRNEEEWKRERV